MNGNHEDFALDLAEKIRRTLEEKRANSSHINHPVPWLTYDSVRRLAASVAGPEDENLMKRYYQYLDRQFVR